MDHRLLDKRQFRVTVNGKFSPWHDVLSRIPRGSILGPLLFIIYINDLPEVCNNLHTKLYIYADDIKLYRHICSREDQDKLQNDIHRVTHLASEWLLKLNVDKCCRISFVANVNSLCNVGMLNGNRKTGNRF